MATTPINFSQIKPIGLAIFCVYVAKAIIVVSIYTCYYNKKCHDPIQVQKTMGTMSRTYSAQERERRKQRWSILLIIGAIASVVASYPHLFTSSFCFLDEQRPHARKDKIFAGISSSGEALRKILSMYVLVRMCLETFDCVGEILVFQKSRVLHISLSFMFLLYVGYQTYFVVDCSDIAENHFLDRGLQVMNFALAAWVFCILFITMVFIRWLSSEYDARTKVLSESRLSFQHSRAATRMNELRRTFMIANVCLLFVLAYDGFFEFSRHEFLDAYKFFDNKYHLLVIQLFFDVVVDIVLIVYLRPPFLVKGKRKKRLKKKKRRREDGRSTTEMTPKNSALSPGRAGDSLILSPSMIIPTSSDGRHALSDNLSSPGFDRPSSNSLSEPLLMFVPDVDAG